MADQTAEPDSREPLARRVLFTALAAGELLRILLLALVGANRLAAASGNAPADGAWLLVYLAPHAVLASAFLFTVAWPDRRFALVRFLLPAKLLGLAAGAATIAFGLASGSSVSLALAFAGMELPERLCLAAVAAWDFGVLAAVATLLLTARRGTAEEIRAEGPRPPAPSVPAGREPTPSNPVYREADVEVVEGERREEGGSGR